MSASVVTVPCDRCGRHRRTEESTDAPFSFCGSCGLFVCSDCWSSAEPVCDSCLEARAAQADDAPKGHSRRAARATDRRARRPRQSSSSRKRGGVTSLGSPRIEAADAHGAAVAPAADASVIEPVGARTRSASGVDSPRWARRLPDPFVVRLANWLTDGHAFGLIVATLVGAGVIAGAWAVAVGARLDVQSPLGVPAVIEQSIQGARSSASADATPSPTPARNRYFVRSGDTLAKIAGRVYGDESLWPAILEANRDTITDPDHLNVGTSLWIPQDPATP